MCVTVKTNLGAIVIRKEKGEALVVLEMPESAKANETVTVNAVAPALYGGEKVKARLEINGLAGYEAVEVNVPGRFSITLPEEMHKGRYIFTVTGAGIRPAVGILKVDI